MLLTADWHLTDNPRDEYRWSVFDHVKEWIGKQQIHHPEVRILGDLTDRKDRHSAALVNRLMVGLDDLIKTGAIVHIIMGNHDIPLNGPPFWRIINLMEGRSGLHFYEEPAVQKDHTLMLPYCDDPKTEWDQLPLNAYKALFIHQTVTGAVGNNGHVLENPHMPALPSRLKIYSGDIHISQKIANVFYVGAPHPVAFGDDYPPQMVELDNQLEIKQILKVPTIQKLILRINAPADLAAIKTRPFDQARIICQLPIQDMERWPAMQDEITSWVKSREVDIASLEPEITGVLASPDVISKAGIENDPEEILRMFAAAEAIDDRLLDAGVALLKETRG